MAEKEVHKIVAKKPVRKVAPKKATSKTAPAKKTATKTTVRKAPTPVAAKRASTKTTNLVRIVGVVAFFLIVGGSIMVGVSGDGQINIEGAISERRKEATPEQQTVIDSISVQETKLPDGGLVPSGVPVEVPKPKPVASSTQNAASSTEAVASSTDAVSDEVEVTEEVPETETEGEDAVIEDDETSEDVPGE